MYLDFIIDFVQAGDYISIECGESKYSGSIVKITPDLIAIRTGQTIIVKKDSEITNPPTIGSNVTPIIEQTINDTKEIVEETEVVDTHIENGVGAETSVTIKSQSTPITDSIASPKLPGVKIVGKIDLDAISGASKKNSAGIAQKITMTPTKNNKSTVSFKDLGELRVLVEDEHIVQNNKFVPAIGEVKLVCPNRNYGFIRDAKTGKDVFFSFNQIIDSSIDKTVQSMLHMHVIYSIQGSERGNSAITIHRPNTVKELIQLANKLINIEEFRHAVRVLDHILDEYPENFAANELKETIKNTHIGIKPRNFPSKTKRDSNLYNQAKECHLAKKYSQAIEYYTQAIKAGEKLEASIKDLGMLYAQLYKQGGENSNNYREDVVTLLLEHRKDLPRNISTLYYLENLYSAIQDYNKYLEVARELLEEQEIKRDNNKRIQLLRKMAAVYVQIEDIVKALEAVETALELDPENIWALQLKAAIESENKANIQEVISATHFESLTSGGFSKYIQQTLEEYTEYAGVKIKDSGQFDEKTLSGIRSIIEKLGGRAKDRAPYLLTEAKLMQDVESENTSQLRTVLARYCIDMATTHIVDNSPLDVIRFYYNEAFSLEENYDNNAQNVAIYLLTQIYDYNGLLQATNQHVPVNTALKHSIGTNVDIKWWINILYMCIYNRAIAANISSLLYSNLEYQTKALRALNTIGISVNQKPTKETFTDAWNSAREKLLLYNQKVVATIRNVSNTSNLDDLYRQLLSLDNINKEWMCWLDINHLNYIISNIAPAIGTYLKSSGYRNKETNINNAYGQINQLVADIKTAPTKLSYEELLPMLDKIECLLEKSFSEVVRMSVPKISIKLLSEQTVVDANGLVNIQVELSNHKDSSPIKEVSLYIDENNGIKQIKSDDILYNAIEGGESHIFKLQLEVEENVIQQKAAAVTILCNYKSGGDIKQISNQLSLKLYSQEEFTPIENPYAPLADGGPVPLNSKMFYGRETEIENIVDAIIKSPSKQIIIYGQKRSGKSSVMLHLKQSLLNTGKTFCVFFSLGEILKNLNEASFYYKILYSIKQELYFMALDGKQIPNFDIPTVKDFKEEDEENPLNTFSKYMINFKLLCKQTQGWEDKNLVVMIDEFTYLYSGIKKGNISPSIMKQWKAITQNERAQFSVVLVGQDVVPSFKKEDYARNAFGVIQDMRLTYLKEEPARALIEKPILDENGHSRYIGDAVSRIIEWTSRNPYYIQIFCSRLVDFMNNNKSISVTEADVNEVARSFIEGSDALEEDKFDNLIRAGEESDDLQEYAEEDVLSVLRQIALRAKNIGYCNRADIDVFVDKNKETAIINDLCNREVLETKSDNNYKIQVKLFQEWLLKH